jgi:hypothetical protein
MGLVCQKTNNKKEIATEQSGIQKVLCDGGWSESYSASQHYSF